MFLLLTTGELEVLVFTQTQDFTKVRDVHLSCGLTHWVIQVFGDDQVLFGVKESLTMVSHG
jgi:hypothetical protein